MARSPISRLAAHFARLPLFLVTVLVALTLLGVCSRQASATVYYVSTMGTGNGSTWATAGPLQTIIMGAHSGDQVWVKFGTYTGNFTATDGVAVYGHFAGTETSLTQRQLTNTAYATILDANGSGSVYTISGSATKTNMLDGFTLQNGRGTNISGSTNGAGLLDLGSDTLLVTNCVFLKDLAPLSYNVGGALSALSDTSTITACTFMNCTGGSGAGVFANNTTITNCVFSANTASYGGALVALGISKIINCTFTGNSATETAGDPSGVGGAIHAVEQSTVICTGCTFTSNSAANRGGAIYDDGNTAIAIITDCTFGGSNASDANTPQALSLNSAGSTSAPSIVKDSLIIGTGTATTDPDGIDVDTDSSGNASYVTFTNNTIVNTNVGINIATTSGAVSVANSILEGNGGGLDDTGNVPFTSTNNDVYGNTNYGYQGASLSSTDLTVDPLFVDAGSGDYQLSSTSTLINAGDDSYVNEGDTDLADNPRIYGSAVDIGAYEFYPAPTITSFTPTSGPVGTVITITGTNLGNLISVRFHNANATTYSVNGAGTQLTVTVPSGAGTGTITVTTRGGTVKTATNFTVTSAAPTITSFSPTSGPIGTIVTITGTNFTGATSVKFDGTAATTFTVVSATSITATVPTGAATGTISVTTPGGTATSPNAFTVIPAPTITSFTPTSGPVGTVVTITGTNLKGTTVVRFHNANATVFSVNAAGTQLTVTVPSGAGTGTITVTTPGGSVKTATNFTVTAPLPTVKTLTFNPATIAPGGSSTGTVTLSGVAPQGGAVVSVSQGAFTFTTVTVPAGQTTATFGVMAVASAPAGSYVFTASYNSSSASATLTVN